MHAAKSSLTGILGDSNCGGFWGPELKYAGYMIVPAKAGVTLQKPVEELKKHRFMNLREPRIAASISL